MSDQETNKSKVAKSPLASGKSVVSKTLQFDGNIKGDEDLSIEGTVEGSILLTNSIVTVAKTGIVRGDIVAKIVVVEGEVRGEMRGSEMVEIAPTGVVHGDIRAPRVKLQDGCQFKGQVDMDHKEAAPSERARPPQPVPPSARKPSELKLPLKAPTLSVRS